VLFRSLFYKWLIRQKLRSSSRSSSTRSAVRWTGATMTMRRWVTYVMRCRSYARPTSGAPTTRQGISLGALAGLRAFGGPPDVREVTVVGSGAGGGARRPAQPGWLHVRPNPIPPLLVEFTPYGLNLFSPKFCPSHVRNAPIAGLQLLTPSTVRHDIRSTDHR
jgi:hypothetical protein